MTLYLPETKNGKRFNKEIAVPDGKVLRGVVRNHHICAKYTGGKIGVKNFERADTVVFLCNNMQSDNPDDWCDSVYLMNFFPNVDMFISETWVETGPDEDDDMRNVFYVYFPLAHVLKNYYDYKRIQEVMVEKYDFLKQVNIVKAGKWTCEHVQGKFGIEQFLALHK